MLPISLDSTKMNLGLGKNSVETLNPREMILLGHLGLPPPSLKGIEPWHLEVNPARFLFEVGTVGECRLKALFFCCRI